jgi:hypothetical protein
MSTSTVVGHASRQHQGSHLGDGCNHRNVAAGCASGEFQIFPSLLSSWLLIFRQVGVEVDVVGGSILSTETRIPRKMNPLTYRV